MPSVMTLSGAYGVNGLGGAGLNAPIYNGGTGLGIPIDNGGTGLGIPLYNGGTGLGIPIYNAGTGLTGHLGAAGVLETIRLKLENGPGIWGAVAIGAALGAALGAGGTWLVMRKKSRPVSGFYGYRGRRRY